MKIGFCSLYFDALGGGERYILQMAGILSVKHEVVVFGETSLKDVAISRFGLDLSKVKFMPSFFGMNPLQKIIKTRQFDVLFYVTDGSLFITGAGKNILIVQVPQRNMYHNDIFTEFKLKFWKTQLVYSEYVKKFIDDWWKINTTVLPPAVETVINENHVPKENKILSVGRFFPSPHTKRQDVLIKAFKTLKGKGFKNWKLVLAGGVDDAGSRYLTEIKNLAKGSDIEIRTNIPYKELSMLYSTSRIYWHAAGFGADLSVNPERAEHFGITTLEAMSAGCVPVVFPAGGQAEIVNDGINGLYWNNENELVSQTTRLINDSTMFDKLSVSAVKKSREFGITEFKNRLNKLIT